MKPSWSWHGIAALVIASCVSIGWAVAFIIAVAFESPLADATSDLLGTVGGGLLAALGAFMGAAIASANRHQPLDTTRLPEVESESEATDRPE